MKTKLYLVTVIFLTTINFLIIEQWGYTVGVSIGLGISIMTGYLIEKP